MEQFKQYQYQEEASGLQMHSVGVVVEDSDTGEIEVSPLEKLNTQEAGHIKSKSRLLEGKLPGEKKEAVNASIKSKDTVSATWLAVTGGNRVTAPHMFKNELVMLWRFANDPKYYWTRLNSDNPGLRRAEQAVYKWSNADKETEEVLSDLGYTLDVNAVEGYVKFTNDKGKNENAVAAILLDFKSGFIEVSCENVTLKIDGAGDSVTIKAKTVLVDSEEVTVTGDLKVLGKVGAEGFSGKSVKADSGTFGKLKVGKLTSGSMEKAEDDEIWPMPASYAKGTATIPAAGKPSGKGMGQPGGTMTGAGKAPGGGMGQSGATIPGLGMGPGLDGYSGTGEGTGGYGYGYGYNDTSYLSTMYSRPPLPEIGSKTTFRGVEATVEHAGYGANGMPQYTVKVDDPDALLAAVSSPSSLVDEFKKTV